MSDEPKNPELSEESVDLAAEAALFDEVDDAEVLEHSEAQDDSSETSVTTKKKGGGLATFVSMLALLLSIAALAAGYYLYNQLSHQQSRGYDSAHQLEEKLGTNTANLSAQMDERLGGVSASIAESSEIVSQVQQRQSELEDSLTLLRTQTNGSKRDWLLAEIQFLIQIASDRLTFMRDRNTAIAALETAQSRLKKLSDSSFMALSRRLADDISQLKSQQTNNPLDGLAKLEQEFGKLAPTPAPSEPQLEPANTSAIDAEPESSPSMKNSLMQSLQKRFRVRSHEKPLNPLDRNTVDWQNMSILQLRLEGLRLAVQQDNQTAFKHSLVSIREWVVTRLEQAQQPAILVELDALNVENVFPPLPNLDETQSILRALLQQEGSK